MEAKKLFGGKDGDKLKKDIAALRSAPTKEAANEGLTPEQKQKIKVSLLFFFDLYNVPLHILTIVQDAIARAQNLDEIQKLELILQSGKMPKDYVDNAQQPEASAGDAMDTTK